MAKNKSSSSHSSNEAPQLPPLPEGFKLPEGYARRTEELKGYWDFTVGPIHFIPNRAILLDSSIDEEKPSVLIIGTLVDPCKLVLKANDTAETTEKTYVDGMPGDSVGIWGKPGMREVRNLAGIRTFMYYTGEKDTGKKNPMKLFEVLARDSESRPLPVEDKRDESAGARTWVIDEVATAGRERARYRSRRSSRDDDDDFDFR